MTAPGTFVLDGLTTPAEGSVLDAVLAAGIPLPHLCKDDNLAAIGACRTCLVEADGRIVAACSIPAGSVREVVTGSERAARVRRGVLELTAAMVVYGQSPGGPLSSTFADTMRMSGAATLSMPIHTAAHTDVTNSFFSFHEDACILCGRCVTACQALQHISAIGIGGRGRETRVTPGADETFRESVCTSCGSCVAACPTSALRPKTELRP